MGIAHCTYLSVDCHLGYCHIRVQVFVCMYVFISLGNMFRKRIAGSYDDLVFSLLRKPNILNYQTFEVEYVNEHLKYRQGIWFYH